MDRAKTNCLVLGTVNKKTSEAFEREPRWFGVCALVTAPGRRNDYLRCRIRARIRRLLLPILRRPRPVLLTPIAEDSVWSIGN